MAATSPLCTKCRLSRMRISSVLSVTKAARRSQVQDAAGTRAAIAIRMNVGHHVVPQLALVAGRQLEVDVVDGGSQFVNLRLRDRQTQLALGLGQRDPQFTPGRVDALPRPKPAHRFRGVAANQGIFVKLLRRSAGTRHGTAFVLEN